MPGSTTFLQQQIQSWATTCTCSLTRVIQSLFMLAGVKGAQLPDGHHDANGSGKKAKQIRGPSARTKP